MPSDRRSSSAGSGHSSRSRAERASGSMGQDGGEAGRRIAAEDEYIRRELSDTNAFCNAFWGQNDIGFDAIAARMKTSQRTLEDLKLLYKERADIEAEYAKRLAKLAKQALGSHETGALKTAFDVVKIELDTTSRTHNDLASMIKKDLEGSVGDFASRSWSARKNAQANIEKLHKNKQTQEQYVNKSREKYEQDCIKINGYTAQSSLVQGKDLDKVAYKLDKAQATVNQNDKDYQNFVRALKDTTVKWNAEWKAYLDQCQDQEEERIDFTKSNLWNYANAVSAVCVADDESCERIRVSLENVETPRDIQFFIQHCGTGSLMPAPPEYINYAKGQAPPARPVYHTAKFQRNTVRPTQLPVPQTQPSPQQQQQQQQQHQQQQQQYVPQQQQQQQQPPQPQSKSPSIPPSVPAAMGAPSTKPVPPEPLQSIAQTHTYANAPPSGAADGAHSPSKLPPGAVALPGMASAATQVSQNSAAMFNDGAPGPAELSTATSTSPRPDPQRRMSAKHFLARTSSISNAKMQSTRVGPIAPLGGANGGHGHSNSITAPVQGSQGSNYGAGSAPVAAAATTTDDEDPIAKALASLRMRPGGRSPGPARRESLTAESPQPPPFAQPGQIVQNMPPQRAHSPSPSMSYGGQHPPPARARSPSAAFMQAPNRATSPLPVEEVVGQYGQSFPGERKSLSRQNSVASHAGAGVQSPQQRPKSPMKPEQGFAGVGARGRSPSPQPWSRPTQQQQQQQQQQAYQPPSHHAGQTPDQPRTGTLSRRQSNIPPRSTTPLGISLDATGSVTHDQMAEDFMRRAGSVPPPPQQQQPAPPSQTGVAGVPASQAQPPRPASVVHANYQHSHHQTQPSVSSQYGQAPVQQNVPPHMQSPYSYQGSLSKAHQPYQGQHTAQASMYSNAPVAGQPAAVASAPTAAPAPAQYGGYAGGAYAQSSQPHQPPPSSQSMPAHLAQHQQHPSTYANPPQALQSPYQQQQQQQQQAVQPTQQQQPAPPIGYYGHAAAPTAASAYMQEYLQQQQQQQQPQTHGAPLPNGSGHSHQPSTMSLQQQQQQQWGRSTSPAPGMGAAQSAPAPVQVQVQGGGAPQPAPHAPTGQYSDSGKPILFYVKALYDYQATNPDEFSFTTGDIIAVTHTEADGWWQGELLDEARRKPGATTFPSNFVALLM